MNEPDSPMPISISRLSLHALQLFAAALPREIRNLLLPAIIAYRGEAALPIFFKAFTLNSVFTTATAMCHLSLRRKLPRTDEADKLRLILAHGAYIAGVSLVTSGLMQAASQGYARLGFSDDTEREKFLAMTRALSINYLPSLLTSALREALQVKSIRYRQLQIVLSLLQAAMALGFVFEVTRYKGVTTYPYGILASDTLSLLLSTAITYFAYRNKTGTLSTFDCRQAKLYCQHAFKSNFSPAASVVAITLLVSAVNFVLSDADQAILQFIMLFQLLTITNMAFAIGKAVIDFTPRLAPEAARSLLNRALLLSTGNALVISLLNIPFSRQIVPFLWQLDQAGPSMSQAVVKQASMVALALTPFGISDATHNTCGMAAVTFREAAWAMKLDCLSFMTFGVIPLLSLYALGQVDLTRVIIVLTLAMAFNAAGYLYRQRSWPPAANEATPLRETAAGLVTASSVLLSNSL